MPERGPGAQRLLAILLPVIFPRGPMSTAESRISEITAELQTILERRLTELGTAMKSAEGVTRQIVSAEMEITRYKQLQDSLGGEMGDVKRELGALRARADEVRSQHGGMLGEREKLRGEVAKLEQDAREGGGETERLRARSRALEDECEQLRKETERERVKIKALEDNVQKMRKLKEELMQSISGLSAQMASLNLSSKE
jgi:chromosome segregation ATPase